MQVTLREEELPVKIVWDHRLSDAEFYQFCVDNPDRRFERTAEGEIIVVPPAGGESDHQTLLSGAQLLIWSISDGRGTAFGPTSQFILPTGAAYSPDACWVSNQRLSGIPQEDLRKFMHVTPEFVIEVMSPSDRLRAAQNKMRDWMRAGVDLGWLIRSDQRTVFVYRAGEQEPEVMTGILKLAGEGPVAGFELDLKRIWAGVRFPTS